MTEPLFRFHEGRGPLVVAMPHVGTHLPEEVSAGLTDFGRRVLDTDWHVDRLYDFLHATDASSVIATHSRTVADLNRSPENEALYPGRFETGLTPTTGFGGEPLYLAGLTWEVTITDNHMTIGCQHHELTRWWGFSDRAIERMDYRALYFWRAHKATLKALCYATGRSAPIPVREEAA